MVIVGGEDGKLLVEVVAESASDVGAPEEVLVVSLSYVVYAVDGFVVRSRLLSLASVASVASPSNFQWAVNPVVKEFAWMGIANITVITRGKRNTKVRVGMSNRPPPKESVLRDMYISKKIEYKDYPIPM